jgi:hypothetical protein
MGRRCKFCTHYFEWGKLDSGWSGAEGVCTAPRPFLGPAPNREVNGKDGEKCQMFNLSEDFN